MAQIRIAFTGAHSTGKSTLLAECKVRFRSRLHAIENIARTLILSGLPMGDTATVKSLLVYVQAQFTAEQEIPPLAELVISNRTCIDSFAYARANTKLGLPSAIPEYVIGMLDAVALRECSLYHLHVYFPAEFPQEADLARPSLGEPYRRVVDDSILGFLENHNIPFLRVTGPVEKRINALSEGLSRIGMV